MNHSYLQTSVFCLLTFFSVLKAPAQQDTLYFKSWVDKVGDSLVCKTTYVFNPAEGICPLTNSTQCFLRNVLIEEKGDVGGLLNGVSKKYYPSGQLREIGNYVLGSKIGLFCEFYKNGQIKTLGEYYLRYTDSLIYLNKRQVETIPDILLNDTEVITTLIGDSEGVKDHKWLYFKENGELVSSEDWDKGLLKKN